MSFLLISRYALDCQRYNTSYIKVTWEDCSLRKWLNETFLQTAFSEEDQKYILDSIVFAKDSSTDKFTIDKVFLLDEEETKNYFGDAKLRQCQGTIYCYAQGAKKGSNGNCWWWLRSFDKSNNAVCVFYSGGINADVYQVNSETCSIRPALWIGF